MPSVVNNKPVADELDNPRLLRVLRQLRQYEHPLLRFDAQGKGEGVEVVIMLREERTGIDTYRFELLPRDLDGPQFEWQFQRQLYDCLHDYLIEMFTRTPQDKTGRRGLGH